MLNRFIICSFFFLFTSGNRVLSQVLTQQEIQHYKHVIEALNAISSGSDDHISFQHQKIKLKNVKNELLQSSIESMSFYHKKDINQAYKIIYNAWMEKSKPTSFDTLIAYQQMGVYCLDVKDYVNAEKYLSIAYKIILKNNIKEGVVSTWLIELYRETKAYKKAIQMTKQKFRINRNEMDTYINLALLYQENEHIELSEKYLEKSLNLLRKKYTAEDQMFIYLFKGNNQLKKGNKLKAIEYFKKSLSDTIGMKNWYPYVMANYQLTNTYMELKQYDSCSYYLNGFFLCPCLDNETQAWLYQVKADFYKKIGNKGQYLLNLEKSNAFKDSLISNTRSSYEQLASFSNEQFNLIEENLQVNQKNTKLLSQQKNVFLILLILSLILFLGSFLFVRFRNMKKNEILKIQQRLNASEIEQLKLKEESLQLQIKAKNMDLNQLAKNITIKKEFDEQQKILLKELMEKPTEELKQELRKIYNQVNNYDQIEEHLEILQSDIEHVNSEFYLKMKRLYPHMTHSEIEICSLHLLKLSTKEIATIRNVNARTIQINRYRIKKKMGLSEEIDLIQFLEENVL